MDAPPRVAYIEGTAAYEPAGQVDWSEVTVNLPLLNGDRIFSHPGSRLEVELGYENYLRIGDETDFTLNRLDGEILELDLKLGDLILRVGERIRCKIHTPFAVVRIKDFGLYRIQVQESGTTRVIVRDGRAEVENTARAVMVDPREELWIDGPQSALTRIGPMAYLDSLDLWSDRRNALHVGSRSASYTAHGVPGVYDLDHYGYWDSISDYGSVWFPTVAVGWVPYRAGRWVHYPGWGWTWVSFEPWGWVPYHYGFWTYYRPYSRWCWVPGFSFSFWWPARVDFFFGGGYVGWVPWRPGRHHPDFEHSWRRRPREAGLTLVHERDFHRGRPDQTFVERPERSTLEPLEPGLPSELERRSARYRRPSSDVWPTDAAGREDGGRLGHGRSSSGPSIVVVGSNPESERTRTGIGEGNGSPGSSWSGRSRPDSSGAQRGWSTPLREGTESNPEGAWKPTANGPRDRESSASRGEGNPLRNRPREDRAGTSTDRFQSSPSPRQDSSWSRPPREPNGRGSSSSSRSQSGVGERSRAPAAGPAPGTVAPPRSRGTPGGRNSSVRPTQTRPGSTGSLSSGRSSRNSGSFRTRPSTSPSRSVRAPSRTSRPSAPKRSGSRPPRP